MLSKYIILRGKQRSDLKALLSHTLTQHTHNHFSTPAFTPIKISVSLAHATNIVAHVCLFSVEIISSLINLTLCACTRELYNIHRTNSGFSAGISFIDDCPKDDNTLSHFKSLHSNWRRRLFYGLIVSDTCTGLCCIKPEGNVHTKKDKKYCFS